MLSKSRLMRGAATLAFFACVAAVALGRMYTPEPPWRSVEKPRFASFSTTTGRATGDNVNFVDLETGLGLALKLPEGERLELPSCSSWRDETGQGQVVGCWTRRSGRGEDQIASEIGLARFSFPGGEPLDRVATDVTPAGSPCWHPGTRARVVFVDRGGTLYRFAFEGSGDPDAGPDGRDDRPVPIVWKTAPPGEDERSVRIFDPTWPEGRPFADRLIVSLSLQVKDGDRLRYTAPRLWWLRLDDEGGAIVAAGPLTRRRDEPASGEVRERCPKVVRMPSGETRLAYLVRDAREGSWRLDVAPLEFDADEAPHADSDAATTRAESCALVAPAFSPDGRWIYYLAAPQEHEDVRRVAMTTEVAGRSHVASRE